MNGASNNRSMSFSELRGNFDGFPGENEGCSSLLLHATPGNYRVSLSLSEKKDGKKSEAFVFFGRRMLTACFSSSDTPREISDTVHVGAFIPRGSDRPYPGQLAVTLIAPSLQLTGCRIEPADLPTIHIAGDSTVTDQPAEHPYHPTDNYAGWGQMLPIFLNGSLAVANHAHSGLTTETFRTEGHYDILLDELRPGDYVFFQFAHNDQKLPHLDANGGYRDNLIRYAAEIRERGANPVFVTPLSRNTWNQTGYNDLLKNHAEAVIALGAELSVPILDLHGHTLKIICRTGQEQASSLYHTGDYTHTNDCGAFLAARFIASSLRDITGFEGAYDPLAKAVDPKALAEDTPAFRIFSSLLRKQVQQTAPASQNEDSAGPQRDIVPEDLTGPAVWQIDENGVLKNPDGSPVAPP